MALRNAVQLICYPDRLGKNLKDLRRVIDRHFADAIGGVHLLPFYPSNADAGFSPLTHKEVDPRYGDWEDIEGLAADYDLCVDLTINHISDESVEFRDFREKGFASPWADLFVDVDKLGEMRDMGFETVERFGVPTLADAAGVIALELVSLETAGDHHLAVRE